MLKNKAHFNAIELAGLFGEESLHNFPNDLTAKSVSIDTRKLDKEALFVAITGERVDAHDKVKEAFEKGAVAAIIDKKKLSSISNECENKPLIAVEDTVEALGKLGNYHRKRFSFKVIAVGGSNGKTTTKEMIASVLSQKYKVLKTFENFNNQIGVPLMLLQFSDEYDVAVLEIGTNQPGEIAILSEMVEPTHGLITNIGKEHLEQLIDIAGVELEETFLFGWLRARGICYVNDDDERLRRYIEVLERYRRYGTGENVETRGEIKLNDDLTPAIKLFFEEEEIEVQMTTIGIASAQNAIAAAAIGFTFDLSKEQVKEGLESFEPLKEHGYGRMSPEYAGDFLIINDTYNANPPSMKLALDNLELIEREGEKIAVLSDMRELGEASLDEHKDILDYSIDKLKSHSSKILITGNEFKKAIDTGKYDGIMYFETKTELISYLMDNLSGPATILVKASRGLKMEEVVNAINERFK